MTVQEAIDWLRVASAPFHNKDKRTEAINTAIKCMEELEQYRTLGTVEELKEAREKQIHKIKFDNACGCIFDEEVLFNAIDLECRNRNCYRSNCVDA